MKIITLKKANFDRILWKANAIWNASHDMASVLTGTVNTKISLHIHEVRSQPLLE